jgi:hypothetical protein
MSDLTPSDGPPQRDPLTAILIALAPLASGAAFFAWLQSVPKVGQCGLSSWALVASVPLSVAPAVAAGIATRRSGKGVVATALVAAIVLIVTLAVCAYAFASWFGLHRCGE